MADEALKEEFELEEQEQEQEKLEQIETKKPEDQEPEYSESEAKARAGGWVPKEEWEGDPDDWISHQQFNRFGGIIDSLKDSRAKYRQLEESVDTMLQNNNKYNKQQLLVLERQIDDLKADRTKAIDLADTKEADRIQDQIDKMNAAKGEVESVAESQPSPQKTHPAIEDWEQENDWITQNTPKATFAKAEFQRYLSENAKDATDVDDLVKDAIKEMEKSIAREFPAKNPNRDAAPTAARGRNTPTSKTDQLTMADLTVDEKKVWDEFGSSYKNKEEFLESVKNARTGE